METTPGARRIDRNAMRESGLGRHHLRFHLLPGQSRATPVGMPMIRWHGDVGMPVLHFCGIAPGLRRPWRGGIEMNCGNVGAGEGNRTLVVRLGSSRFRIISKCLCTVFYGSLWACKLICNNLGEPIAQAFNSEFASIFPIAFVPQELIIARVVMGLTVKV